MLDDDVEPDVSLNLFHHVSELKGGDDLNGLTRVCEGLEEGDNTLGDTALFSPFMYINRARMIKQNLCICILLLLRFFRLWL